MNDSFAFGRDLTLLAKQSQLDPVVGREKEIDEVLRVLCRRTKSNPLLLGEPGVGKTALVEGVAQLIAAGAVPPVLRGRKVFELQLGALMAGTQFRGDLEKRMQDFLTSAREERTLVFIDEIHLLVVAGRGSGMDVANLLKPMLARGEVPCIGASTPSEAAEMFKVDPAMERRFQTVLVEEPSSETVEAILHAVRPRLEAHHGLKIDDEAIRAVVSFSLQQKNQRRNPDRALDILEDICAREQLRLSRATRELLESSPEVDRLEQELAAATTALDLEAHVRARSALDAVRHGNRESEGQKPEFTVIGVEHVRGLVASS